MQYYLIGLFELTCHTSLKYRRAPINLQAIFNEWGKSITYTIYTERITLMDTFKNGCK